MKHSSKASALSVAFIAGVVVGAATVYLYSDHLAKAEQREAAAGNANEDQYVCVEFYQPGLYQRAGLYRQKVGHWPTNVQALVEAQLLPAVSQVHRCPSQIRLAGGYDNLGGGHVGDFSFIEKQQPKSMADYSYSPYCFQIKGRKFIVTCTFDKSHTREAMYEK